MVKSMKFPFWKEFYMANLQYWFFSKRLKLHSDQRKPLYEFGKCWKMSDNSGGEISLAWTEILPSIKARIFTVDLWIQFFLGQKLSSHILSILSSGSWARSANGDSCEKLLQYLKNLKNCNYLQHCWSSGVIVCPVISFCNNIWKKCSFLFQSKHFIHFNALNL